MTEKNRGPSGHVRGRRCGCAPAAPAASPSRPLPPFRPSMMPMLWPAYRAPRFSSAIRPAHHAADPHTLHAHPNPIPIPPTGIAARISRRAPGTAAPALCSETRRRRQAAAAAASGLVVVLVCSSSSQSQLLCSARAGAVEQS
jgi:hypothetical protein